MAAPFLPGWPRAPAAEPGTKRGPRGRWRWPERARRGQRAAEKKAPARAAAESCAVLPDSIAAIAMSPR